MAAGLDARMAEVAAATEAELDRLQRADDAVPERLLAAMRYATLGAGKRLRPFLVHAAGGLAGDAPGGCLRVGAAVELIHCYSLVHDDLPAMDDAELRRGKLACHRAFGEAVAILAGDALVALAFEVLARADWPCRDAALKLDLLAGLGRAAGGVGMCGGQMLDLASTGVSLSEDELVRLQNLKTGAIIGFALDAGCQLAGLPEAQRRAVAVYGRSLGLAFQIKDDLLDVEGSAAETGKTPGRDDLLGRTTFVSLLGSRGAEDHLLRLRTEGLSSLDFAGVSSSVLVELFDFVIRRRA